MADTSKDTGKEAPKNVHEAVIAVMASIGTLYKTNENKFDKYTYASIDDFIAFVRGHCYEAGLYIVQDEEDAHLVDVVKKDGKPMAMWWARYAFTLCHIGGSSVGPVRRSVMVQANGAQASGSAQSYGLKQYMRSQFLIPTGDKDDPDKESTEISADGGDRETDLQKKASRIRREFLRSINIEQLKGAWADNAVDLDQIKRASETAHEFLLNEYHTRFKTLDMNNEPTPNKPNILSAG